MPRVGVKFTFSAPTCIALTAHGSVDHALAVDETRPPTEVVDVRFSYTVPDLRSHGSWWIVQLDCSSARVHETELAFDALALLEH